jgi:hypothetical protein
MVRRVNAGIESAKIGGVQPLSWDIVVGRYLTNYNDTIMGI